MSAIDIVVDTTLIDDTIYVKYEDHLKAINAMHDMCAHGEPIQFYETQEQLNESLKEWQHRLFLDGWIIKASLVTEIVINGQALDGTVGYNEFIFESSISTISILTGEKLEKIKSPEKNCQEETLVHELLHCIYGWLENGSTYEAKYLEGMEHQKLEQMAKSLIMAKYNLDYDYFVE